MYAAAVAAAAAFNLVCSGTITTTSLEKHGETQPYSYTYRVDLGKKKFCESACTAIRDIYEIQPGFIQLEKPVDIDTVTEKRFDNGEIDRQTGHQQILMTSGREADILIMKWDGNCVKRPFSGFPQIETKF